MATKKTTKKKSATKEAMKQIIENSPEPRENPYKELPDKQSFDPNTETKFTILAGIKEDGSFLFEMMGTDKTLTNLLGLADFISTRVEQEKQKQLGTGDALTRQVGSVLIELSKKIDALLATLNQPTNDLK